MCRKLVNGELRGEPDYLLENGMFDPMAALWLFQAGAIDLAMNLKFFHRLHLSEIEYREASKEKAPHFVGGKEELEPKLRDLIDALAEDDFYFLPSCVHEGLAAQNEFPPSAIDITSMAYNCAGGLWGVEEKERDVYVVSVDSRLAWGVPDAYTIIARLLWYMRQHVGILEPFAATFVQARIARADELFEDFSGSAFGAPAQLRETTIIVDSEPVPMLPEGPRPFAGGCETNALQILADIHGNKEHGQHINDEELFERRMRVAIAGFPYAINVSHRNGWAAHQLKPGQLVVLASTWSTVKNVAETHDIVAIEVRTAENERIGILDSGIPLYEVKEGDYGFRELACILSHVTAYVRSNDTSEDHPFAEILLTLEEGGGEEELLDEARGCMRRLYEERSMLSKGPLVASDVFTKREGGIVLRPSPVPDVPNPAEQVDETTAQALVGMPAHKWNLPTLRGDKPKGAAASAKEEPVEDMPFESVSELLGPDEERIWLDNAIALEQAHQLLGSARRMVLGCLEDEGERAGYDGVLAQTKTRRPDPEAKQYKTTRPIKLEQHDARRDEKTVARGTVLYVLFGVILFTLGIVWLTDRERPIRLFLGQINGVLDILAIFLIGAGVVFPIVKTRKLRTRVESERGRAAASAAMLVALAEKHNKEVQEKYLSDTKAWEGELEEAQRTLDTVRGALDGLAHTDGDVTEHLNAYYFLDVVPQRYRSLHTLQLLRDYICRGEASGLRGAGGALERIEADGEKETMGAEPVAVLEELSGATSAEPSQEAADKIAFVCDDLCQQATQTLQAARTAFDKLLKVLDRKTSQATQNTLEGGGSDMSDEELAHGLCEMLLGRLSDDARKQATYNVEGVMLLDQLIVEIREEVKAQNLSEEDIFIYANMCGAFLGECMLKNGLADYGFSWGGDSDGELCLIPHTERKVSLGKIFPVRKVHQCLTAEPEKTLLEYYYQCLTLALKSGAQDILLSLESLSETD